MNSSKNAGYASSHAIRAAGAFQYGQNPENTDKDQNPENGEKTRYIPLTDWPKYHPWPTIGGLRHLMFYRDTNGFSDAFIKRGRRVLVDEKKFFCCVREGRQ